MAVPKKKVSKARRDKRRSHHKVQPVNVVVDSETGEYKRPHHINLEDGNYNGRQVIDMSNNESDEEDEEEEE
jgi:large subunit ribosomal protein L32